MRSDPLDRRHNNDVDPMKKAGLSFCQTEWSVVSNAASAPFDKAGFFCRHADAGKVVLDNNDCTNDFFLAAFPILSLDQNDGVPPDGFNDLGIAERLLDLLDEGREDQGCKVFPAQSQDAGCSFHGIISPLDDHLHRDFGPLV